MTSSPNDAAPAKAPATIDLDAGILFDEFWSELSSDSSIKPDQWLHARRGDPALGVQLQILSMLRNADAELEAWLSTAARNQRTSAQPLSTGKSRSDKPHVPCLNQGELVDGRLRILAELGSGGMGEVYVAWHQVLEREVAVKVLPSDQAQDAEAVARFKRSMALQAKTSGHPNIVAITDAGQHNGHMYLVMEYVAGTDLAMLLHCRHPIPWREVGDWMRQAACGLEHAHQHDLVHRDVKPANLIRAEDGTIKLLDWGLARGEKSSAVDLGATKAFVAMGTSDYISPEQSCDAATADARSDLYSLGCTFYHLLAGRAPFAHRQSATAKIVAHTNETPPPLGAARPDVPPAIETLIGQLMEKDAERRPRDANCVVQELESLLARDLPRRRQRKLPLLMAMVLLCSIAALGYAFWQGGRSTRAPSGGMPHWTRLELIVAPRAADPAARYDPTYFVVKDGQRQPSQSIRVLNRDSAFRIEGRLSQAVPWVVAWIDTAGKFELHLIDGQGRSEEVVFPHSAPGDPRAMTINPNDPPGVHLILVLVDQDYDLHTSQPQDGKPWNALQTLTTQSWQRPPNDYSGVWLNMSETVDKPSDWRGAGGTTAVSTTRSYLQMVESNLPKGIAPLAGFFLSTEPEKP